MGRSGRLRGENIIVRADSAAVTKGRALPPCAPASFGHCILEDFVEMLSALRTCYSLSLICMSLLVGCAAPVTQRTAIDSNARAREEQIQRELAAKALSEAQFRVVTVGWAVLRGAAQDCGERVRPSLGFTALSRERLPADSRQLLSESLGIDDKLRVFVVSKGSSAEAAGMKVGDIILTALAPAPPGESREAARQ